MRPWAGRRLLTRRPTRCAIRCLVYAHRFTVFVPAALVRTDRARKALDNLLRAESPAHTRWDLRYVEPRFRIGVQSMIGFDAVVGCVPQGVTLGEGRSAGPRC